MKKSLIFLLTLVLFSCNRKIASDWSMYQNNIERTALSKYPAIQNPKILWKTEIGIQGYLNNSIVVKNKIYVGSSGLQHNEGDRKDGIYCINADNGQILWHHKTPEDACGVAYSDGKIISTGDDGFLRCLDAESGKEVWSIDRSGPLYAQPLILSDKVMVGDASGKILAVNLTTGKMAWETKVCDSNIRGGLSSDGKKIFGAFVDGTLVALDREGKTIWQTTCQKTSYYGDLENAEIYSTPTVAGNKLIIPYVRDTYYDFPAMQAFDKNTGKLIWEATDDDKRNFNHGNLRSSVAVWNNLYSMGIPIPKTWSPSMLTMARWYGMWPWGWKPGRTGRRRLSPEIPCIWEGTTEDFMRLTWQPAS